MRFLRLDSPDEYNNINPDRAELEKELRAGRSVGPAALGERHVFIRKFRKAYYMPYENITRCFRRVMSVPVKLGCCAGDLRVEYIILSGFDFNHTGAERELAQIQTPGERAAKILLEEFKKRCPNAVFKPPDKSHPSGQSDFT